MLHKKTLNQFLANDLELDFATSELFHMFIKIINMNIKDEKKIKENFDRQRGLNPRPSPSGRIHVHVWNFKITFFSISHLN